VTGAANYGIRAVRSHDARAPAEGETDDMSRSDRKWWTLGAVSVGLFMVMLDNTVVNVALPTISRKLGMGMSSLEWVVNGYTLSFAMLMLTGGKLADYFGRRRFFITGLVLFGVASLVCGLASSGGFLIAARVAQGAGAALLAPATLSIISATFPHEERGTAIGIWAGVSATALAIGPMVGGLVTEHLGWNWIFFINVPIGVAGIFASLRWIDESRDTALEQRLDLGGLILAAAGVFALTYALIDANQYGWGSLRIVGLFVGAAVCLAAFVGLEFHERLPMLDLSRFRSSAFTGGNIVALLIGVALFGIVFYLSLYMQEILGYSAVRAGAAQLPFTGLIVVVAPIAGKLTDRIGPRLPTAAGALLLGLSLLLFTRMGVHSHYLTILPGLIVGGIGTGLAMGPTTVAVLSAVSVDEAGVGSGVVNTFRQTGGALGIAMMGAIVNGAINVLPMDPRYPAQFVSGLHDALLVAASILAVGAVAALALIRSPAAGGGPGADRRPRSDRRGHGGRRRPSRSPGLRTTGRR
jgi:EmrB/QacA subfamily drug resistance transporter